MEKTLAELLFCGSKDRIYLHFKVTVYSPIRFEGQQPAVYTLYFCWDALSSN